MPLFIGCPFPMIFALVGAAGGGIYWGRTAGLWGAAAGFAVGFVLMVGVIWLFDLARHELDE